MHLWTVFDLSRPVFGEAQLDGLQAVINELLPQWSIALRVADDEDSPNAVIVGREGRLYESVPKVAPPRRGLGSAVVSGSYKEVSVLLNHCENTLPPLLNEITIEVYGPSTVEEQTTSSWARKMFEAIANRLPVRYGNVHTSEEYAAKNMIKDETGVEAIGANIIDAIPGLYWLNYFGAPYVKLMGRERLLAAPAYEVKPVGEGVLVGLDPSADAWQSEAYRRQEQEVIAHLGKQFFFSRWDPDRQTVAPEFRPNDA